MLWFTIWFMVILKIPIAYLAYVIWWAVKDPPDPAAEGDAEGTVDGGGGGWWSPRRAAARRLVPGRRPGPHGAPARRPAPGFARARTRA
jgi:hypothetical protein